jgi:hypothetical protein
MSNTNYIYEELHEITDIDNEILENINYADIIIVSIPKYNITFQERIDALQKEWITFIKKEITNNIFPWIHLWCKLSNEHNLFLYRMEKLSKKHFCGILDEDSIICFQMFVKELKYGMTKIIASNKSIDLESILQFVESYSIKRFEKINDWNWSLANQDMSRLQPYTSDDFIEEPEFDKTRNSGFPSWIYISIGRCGCSCEDSDYDSDSDSETENN